MKIKSTKTFHTFIMIVAFGLALCNNSFGQLYNPDPYKIKFDNLDIEHAKKEVASYKIKKISSKEYEIKKGKLKKAIPKSDFYIVEFNEAGNPVTYHCKSYRATADPDDEISETFKYLFEYDSLGNLIHIQEYESHFVSPAKHDERDVYFFYNEKNKLSRQMVLDKCIYDPGYQFRGRTIPNDTSIIHYIFNYANSEKVIDVFREGYGSFSKRNWYDTLTFNCSLDSVFIEKYISKGVKKDSAGRVIENTRYSRHILLKGGGCISPDSPSDIITKFYYNDHGKLIKSESYSRKGDLVRKKRWVYDEKGLLQSIQVENSKEITIYEYEFY